MKKYLLPILAFTITACSQSQNIEDNNRVSNNPVYITYKELRDIAIYTYLSNLSSKDINNYYTYSAIVENAYPDYYNKNHDDQFALHSKVKDAIRKLESETYDSYKKFKGKHDFYSYVTAGIRGTYNFNNNSYELYFNNTPFIRSSIQNADNYNNSLIEKDFYYINDNPRSINYKIASDKAKLLYNLYSNYNNNICLEYDFTLKSIRNDGYVTLKYNKSNIISVDNWNLCNLTVKSKSNN